MKNRQIQTIYQGLLKLSSNKLLCKPKADNPGGASDAVVMDDLTIFEPAETFLRECYEALGGRNNSENPIKIDPPDSGRMCTPYPFTIDLAGQVTLLNQLTEDHPPESQKECRVHAALCCGGTHYAITLRNPPKVTDNAKEFYEPLATSGENVTLPSQRNWIRIKELLEFQSIDLKKVAPKDSYLSTPAELAGIAYEKFFSDPADRAGLVLITGGTGSGKTQFMNYLLALYLESLLVHGTLQQRPRVVAAGDPVETTFFASGSACGKYQQMMEHYHTRSIDFTPRTIGTDVECVSSALRDALRETTSAYVVSELRDTEDFEATLQFAATGQLIFATAHNTSLVDAMRKLMYISSKVESPNSRSLLAQRLKAIVHLKPVFVRDENNIDKQATLPSIWINNPAGVRNFVCDGLTSILPYGGSSDANGQGVLGLAWAAQCLFEKDNRFEAQSVIQKAHELDLSIR